VKVTDLQQEPTQLNDFSLDTDVLQEGH